MALGRALEGAGLEIDVDAAAVGRLARFLDARERWAGTHNLSGPASRLDPWSVDVVDGLAVAGALAPDLPLVDVGAGSGVPGVVVACLQPARRVILVEPRVKRAAFLRTVGSTLGLSALEVIRDRWPIRLDAPVQVVSRAVVSPTAWPALAASAGVQVSSVLRMLAAQRPAFEPAGWTCALDLAYRGADGHARSVQRWDRSPRPG